MGHMKSSQDSPLVTVIVPVYNAEPFLERCLKSVLSQTATNLEVIAVDDGSVDGSLALLRTVQQSDPRLVVLQQENTGQGKARNRALELARGEFILFVDADDFVEKVTIEVVLERAITDEADFVHFDWKLLVDNSDGQSHFDYSNAEGFWGPRLLVGDETEELLRASNLYSVTNLYRKSFLELHHLRFEEGRLYEDNPFVTGAIAKANIVSLVHSPLYIVNPHLGSSTRAVESTDRHALDHVYAVERCFEVLTDASPRARLYAAAYHIKKFGPYYRRRVPRAYRGRYVRDFVDVLSAAGLQRSELDGVALVARFPLLLGWFRHRRYLLYRLYTVGRNTVVPGLQSLLATLRALKQKVSRAGRLAAVGRRAAQKRVSPQTVVFFGFDNRYSGNSRFLFEALLRDPRFEGWTIKFITDDSAVAEEHRLDPSALSTAGWISTARLVIAESWVDHAFIKNPRSTWIQLWHGTPMKRLLFDSNEFFVITKRRRHKNRKYSDVLRWDYLVVDSEVAAAKFATAFLFDTAKMIRSGYPRVKYLLENNGNAPLKSRIRELLLDPGVREKRILLYAPTWRDSSYARVGDTPSQTGLLDLDGLAAGLGEEWVVVFHDHSYLPSSLAGTHTRVVDGQEFEMEELLLISETVVSDYSSVAFDALALDRNIVLFSSDQNAYEEYRGIYRDIWDAFPAAKVGEMGQLVQAAQEAPVQSGRALGRSFASRNSGELLDFVFAEGRE